MICVTSTGSSCFPHTVESSRVELFYGLYVCIGKIQDLTAAESVFKGNVADEDSNLVYQMEKCPMPIIGAINGHAITAGFEISLACDILIASTNAAFADTHCK